MNNQKTHIYLVPGLAAGKEIFKNIKFPEETYEIHIVEWLIPEKGEAISAYAKRMASFVKEPNSILAGVSFGGVMVQEMSLFLDLKMLFVISSVKTRTEIPKRLKLARRSGAYRVLPTGWALSVKDLTKLAIGPRSKKRLRLYQEYLSVREKAYLDWAIKQMLCWDRVDEVPNVTHIHGNADWVFPLENIAKAHVIDGGTHVMILQKGSKVSQLMLEILEGK